MINLLNAFIKKLLKNKPEVVNDKSELNICIEGWKKYREILIEQKLDLDKQIEKIFFSISTGAIGISIAFLDKISPNEEHSQLYYILGLGWLCLVVSTILQFVSYRKTLKKINNSISKVEEITDAKTMEDALQREEEYYTDWRSNNKKIDKENRRSYYFMISGIFFILLFAFVSLFYKQQKTTEPIIINLYDSSKKNP